MNNWLSPTEVANLTGYKHYQKQQEALNQMGVSHKVRPDGTIVVFTNDLTNDKSKVVNGSYKFQINQE